MIPAGMLKELRGQKYLFVGKHSHSAVKICQYAKTSMTGGDSCYKNKFYGISSHRCLQCTTVPTCFNRCVFCWRAQTGEVTSDPDSIQITEWDEPDEIIDELIRGQRHLLTGMGGHPNGDREKWVESQVPRHAALSVLGEPVVYPKFTELLGAFHSRGISTFLVTAGGAPSAIEKMMDGGILPTQFYLSLAAYDKTSYDEYVRPKGADGWERYNTSLDLMRKMKGKTRTVLRMTLMKGRNMIHPEKYAEIIAKADPDYVEVKAYMAVGYSRKRVGMPGMPTFEEIRAFAGQLAEETGYIYADEHTPSRVVLLCRDESAKGNRFIDFSRIGKE
ncbi:S-adenosyl-L-methionine-dependent tRNA 4-demethylwyosine synthase [uncultured archaeon]|nr:S-adenosyl-L-methionine-dependent tRNA 4-demethylwyosine synthase [uncultured archaeon]